jgi:hypothetical protein
MNEPNKSVEDVSPDQGHTGAWWSVRPKLQVILAAEILTVVALLTTDSTSAALIRAWFRPMAITLQQVQVFVTFLAVISLIAVVIEGLRVGRRSLRQNSGEMKVASATSA